MNSTTKARLIAYYLPQYHPIPENDEWWGKGFTEWTNVGKAKPLFKGHYQPRVPADLGYYDLRLPEVREAQAQMAKETGIEGFMYWHYWFGNGKKLLEMPLNEILSLGKPDFPFCLGWANHSWTNVNWNSSEQWRTEKLMIEQLYPGEEDYINHFYYCLRAFKDKRYITVDGKPLFLIFRPLEIPEVNKFLELWRRLALENGLSGIHFVGLNSSGHQKLFDIGFDAVNSNGQWQAESRVKGKYLKLIESKIKKYFGGIRIDKYDYKEIIKYLLTEEDKNEYVYPNIIPQWDRSPRSGRRATIYTDSTPELFSKLLTDAVNIVKNKTSEHRVLFLKSWNEWAEGNYVEPDLIFGKKYLEVIKNILLKENDE